MAANKITVTQLLSTPQAYDLETVLKQQPRLMDSLIDFISLMPDPFIMNELECYVFPQKAIEILTQSSIYQIIVLKRDRLNPKTNEKQTYYPYLYRLFTNFLKTENTQEILLGYVNRLLISLVKKTPQIYQFFKDQPQIISSILSSNRLLDNLKDFLSWFIVQSTMELYIFLKSVFIRTLFSRILEGDTSPILFALISRIYQDVANRYKHCLPEDKQQLLELKKNFQDQDWVNLILLKIGHERPQATYQISKLINFIIEQNTDILEGFDKFHYQHLSEFFIDYQDSSDFMIVIHRYHTEVLKLLLKCLQKTKENKQALSQQLLKRLLVYCTVHQNVSHLQSLLFELICYLKEEKLYHIYKQANVITFLHKNTSESKHKYGLKVFLQKICLDWNQNEELLKQISEDDQKIVKEIYDNRKNALEKCKFFSFKSKKKQIQINENKAQEKSIQSPKKEGSTQKIQDIVKQNDSQQTC